MQIHSQKDWDYVQSTKTDLPNILKTLQVKTCE